MDKKDRQMIAYVSWRFDMWLKGYGTYEQIEKDVKSRKLIAGKDYPTLSSYQQPNPGDAKPIAGCRE